MKLHIPKIIESQYIASETACANIPIDHCSNEMDKNQNYCKTCLFNHKNKRAWQAHVKMLSSTGG